MAVKKDELAKQQTNFNLLTLTQSISSDVIDEELDGLGSIPFDKAKIPSGGNLSFDLPGDSDEETISTTEIEGVILYHHPINSYWPDKYNGGNEPPQCSSFDGKTGIDISTGEVKQCSECPHNMYGSEGQGKACKNIHRCYILREGNPVPLLLALPPTSLSFLRNYIAKKLLFKGLRSYEVVTKITLKAEKNSSGIKYSRAAFSLVGTLSDAQKQDVQKMTELVKSIAKSNVIEIDSADYNAPAPKSPDVIVEDNYPQAPPAPDEAPEEEKLSTPKSDPFDFVDVTPANPKNENPFS